MSKIICYRYEGQVCVTYFRSRVNTTTYIALSNTVTRRLIEEGFYSCSIRNLFLFQMVCIIKEWIKENLRDHVTPITQPFIRHAFHYYILGADENKITQHERKQFDTAWCDF